MCRVKTSPEFRGVAGFCNVIVCTGLKAGNDVFAVLFGREQQDINIGALTLVAAYRAAEAWAIEFRHHPVDERETGTIRPRQNFGSRTPILRKQHFIAELLQRPLHEQTGNRVVIRDQYLHSARIGQRASRARSTLTSSCARRSSVA